MTSPTEYECHAGTTRSVIVLKGELADVVKPDTQPTGVGAPSN